MNYKIPQGKELRVAISGKSGCGNTTVSTLLAQKLNVKLINFTFRQLAAEKNLTLAQVIENAKTNLSYGDIVILLDKRELFRKQEKIDLSFIEFEILHLLMRSPGRVFSKEQIYDIIWNEPYSGDYNVVMRHICNIREKIEDDPGHPVYIQTVRGVGYRFNGNLGSE